MQVYKTTKPKIDDQNGPRLQLGVIPRSLGFMFGGLKKIFLHTGRGGKKKKDKTRPTSSKKNLGELRPDPGPRQI